MAARERTEEDRAARSNSRAKDDSKLLERPSNDVWSPANMLETPPASDGFRYRWVTEYVNGDHLPNRVQRALKEGFTRVTIDDLPDDFVVDEDIKGDGWSRTGGLILMRITEVKAQQREAYYRSRSREGQRAANTLQGINKSDQVVHDNSRRLAGREISGSV